MDDDRLRTELTAMKDQHDAWVRDHLLDIRRIGLRGPDGSDREAGIIRRLCLGTAAGIHMAIADETNL